MIDVSATLRASQYPFEGHQHSSSIVKVYKSLANASEKFLGITSV